MPSNATWTASNNQRQKREQQRKRTHRGLAAIQTAKQTKENRNENQNNDPVRRRSRKGPALLYRSLRLHQKNRFQPGPLSLANSNLARRSARPRAATSPRQQPSSQSLSASHVRTTPTSSHVFHRQHQSRLRAHKIQRRRFHHAAHRRNRLHHRHAQRHLRQLHPTHPTSKLLKRRRSK